MEKSKVYFTNFRTEVGQGLPAKLKKLIKKAGIGQIEMENKLRIIRTISPIPPRIQSGVPALSTQKNRYRFPGI